MAFPACLARAWFDARVVLVALFWLVISARHVLLSRQDQDMTGKRGKGSLLFLSRVSFCGTFPDFLCVFASEHVGMKAFLGRLNQSRELHGNMWACTLSW